MTTLSSPAVFGKAWSRDRVKTEINWRWLLCMLFSPAVYAIVFYAVCFSETKP